MGSFSEVCPSVTIGAMRLKPMDRLVDIDGMGIYRLKSREIQMGRNRWMNP